MKLAIMQPYFMPYLGYFSLINLVDQFILFDTPQFIRHGWIERNKLLQLNNETFYIKVPLVKHSQKTNIKEIKINHKTQWKDKIYAQLVHYKKKAPYYEQVILLLNEILDLKTDSIVELDLKALKVICKYLGINTPFYVFSEMNIEIEKVESPDEWALNICKAIKAEEYYNLPGGKSFFEKEKYDKEGLKLKFLKFEPTRYTQFKNDFVPFLSIIDIMMFNSKAEIREMLNQYELV